MSWPEYLKQEVFTCQGGKGMPHEKPKSYLGIQYCPQCDRGVQRGGKLFAEEVTKDGVIKSVFGEGTPVG